jgi:putative MATE family efflux protein
MNDKRDFTQGSIPKKMLRFILPILAALVLQAMYTAVDMLIVGRFGTTVGLSGVSTGSNIIRLITFTVAGLTTGVTVLIGQYIGEGCKEKLGKVVGSAVLFFFLFSMVLTIFMQIFARPIAVLMQAPEEALEATVLYIRISGAGLLFIVFYNFISGIFRGIGDSVMPLMFVSIACVANILGDLLLVAGFHMDVAGAAIATICAQAISVILSLLVVKRRSLPFEFSLSDIGFSEEIKNFLGVGIPIALQEFLTNLTFVALCAFVNRLGLDASSGYGIGRTLQSFIMMIPSSLVQATSAFVAQNVGAGNEKRAKETMKFSMIFGLCMGTIAGCIIFFYGDVLSGLYTSDTAVIARSYEFLRGFAPEAIVTSIMFSLMGYFNGHSKTMFVMCQGLVQSFLIRLPISYIMSIQPDASLTGVGLAAPIATSCGVIISVIYYCMLQKKMEKMNN